MECVSPVGQALILLTLAFGPAGEAAPGAAAAQAPAAAAQKASTKPSPYRIAAGDVIQLVVWQEPELTRDLTVRIDGSITVPLLGDVTAAGRSASDLAGAIAADLKRFLADPRVTVGISQASGARFFVLGQVHKAGEFPLRGRTTLIQALAAAGGFKEFAKTSEIVIVRSDDSGDTFLHADYKKLESARDASQNIVLLPGDTILVP